MTSSGGKGLAKYEFGGVGRRKKRHETCQKKGIGNFDFGHGVQDQKFFKSLKSEVEGSGRGVEK